MHRAPGFEAGGRDLPAGSDVAGDGPRSGGRAPGGREGASRRRESGNRLCPDAGDAGRGRAAGGPTADSGGRGGGLGGPRRGVAGWGRGPARRRPGSCPVGGSRVRADDRGDRLARRCRRLPVAEPRLGAVDGPAAGDLAVDTRVRRAGEDDPDARPPRRDRRPDPTASPSDGPAGCARTRRLGSPEPALGRRSPVCGARLGLLGPTPRGRRRRRGVGLVRQHRSTDPRPGDEFRSFHRRLRAIPRPAVHPRGEGDRVGREHGPCGAQRPRRDALRDTHRRRGRRSRSRRTNGYGGPRHERRHGRSRRPAGREAAARSCRRCPTAAARVQEPSRAGSAQPVPSKGIRRAGDRLVGDGDVGVGRPDGWPES